MQTDDRWPCWFWHNKFTKGSHNGDLIARVSLSTASTHHCNHYVSQASRLESYTRRTPHIAASSTSSALNRADKCKAIDRTKPARHPQICRVCCCARAEAALPMKELCTRTVPLMSRLATKPLGAGDLRTLTGGSVWAAPR